MQILYLTHRVPDPPNRGDRIRAHHLLRFLAERGRVHLACLADEPVEAESRMMLEELCEQVMIAPVSRRRRWVRASWSLTRGGTATEGLFHTTDLQRVVRNWGRYVQFDAVVAFCSSMVQYATVPELADVPLVVDLVDVDSQKWLDYARAARGVKRHLYRLEAERLRRLEKMLPARARGVTLVSQLEAELYRSFCPNPRTYSVPNGVDLEYFQPAGEAAHVPSGRCVFLGALDYWPNIEGLRWFCHHVWPEVHRQMPQLRFDIVGRRPTAAVKQLTRLPGVELVGEVADVRPYLTRADVAVAPLQIARGIQNKVLEALACGKAVVASPQALEGLAVESGRHAMQADAPAEWIETLLQLHRNAARRAALGAHGRQFVEQHHSWPACLQPFAELLDLEPAVDAQRIVTRTQPA